jgi:hypothetical protein
MKEQFVNYEIALELKELGFNEPCLGYYYDKKLDHFALFGVIEGKIITNKNNNVILAPLWQQVIDWLREKKYVNIEIRMNYPEYKYFYTIGNIGNETFQYVSKETFNYKEAREKAILQALKLIKGGKSN